MVSVAYCCAYPNSFLHLSSCCHGVDTPPWGMLLGKIEHTLPDINDGEIPVRILPRPSPQCITPAIRRDVICQDRPGIYGVDFLKRVIFGASNGLLPTHEAWFCYSPHQLQRENHEPWFQS